LFAVSASAQLPGWWFLVLVAGALAAPFLFLRSPAEATVTAEALPLIVGDAPRSPLDPSRIDLYRWENDGGASRTYASRGVRLNRPTLAACAVVIVCLTCTLDGQGLSRYRNFDLGSSLASVSTLAGVAPSEARVIHRRPAVLQDLEWRLSHWVGGTTTASTDPVELIRFSFYDDQLFRIVVDYAHERTEGLTRADLIEAISAIYGTPIVRTSRAAGAGRVVSRLESDSGSPVAAWGDAGHSVTLYQMSTYGAAFRMILTDSRLEALARKAETQAVRLDEQEAPQREIARQKKEQVDGRAAAEKARMANKGVFRP
jgi:hypothetical protein